MRGLVASAAGEAEADPVPDLLHLRGRPRSRPLGPTREDARRRVRIRLKLRQAALDWRQRLDDNLAEVRLERAVSSAGVPFFQRRNALCAEQAVDRQQVRQRGLVGNCEDLTP